MGPDSSEELGGKKLSRLGLDSPGSNKNEDRYVDGKGAIIFLSDTASSKRTRQEISEKLSRFAELGEVFFPWRANKLTGLSRFGVRVTPQPIICIRDKIRSDRQD